jgi:hypothetical protein
LFGLPKLAVAAEEPEKYALTEVASSLSTTQAGAHPDFTVSFRLSTNASGAPYAATKDVEVVLPSGLFGNPKEFLTCTTLQFGTEPINSKCPQASQVGSTDVSLVGTVTGTVANEPIYNMPAPSGYVARLGFYALVFPVIINIRLDPETDRLVASIENASSASGLVSASSTFWGVPADPSHNFQRLTPVEAGNGSGPPEGRPPTQPDVPFMTNPTECAQQRDVNVTVRSYAFPDQRISKSGPFPQITGCGLVGANPTVALKPSTSQASTGTGLDYQLSLSAKGIEFPNLLYDSELKRAQVTLPEGMTVNPSEAEGLGVCTEDDLSRETYNSGPNMGCPEDSKIGTVEAVTPVIDRQPTGSLYLAKPYENPFGSLIALYMVLKIPDRGVLVRLAGKVTTDPQTGQITTVFDDIPQLPVSNFHLHFREGARAPLITPAACGSYSSLSIFTPWAHPDNTLTRESSFAIESGPDHGPCPGGGLPPFHPSLLAGTQNNAAGTYSPFDVELTRTDAEQEITHFSIKLPPGVVGKLAGIPFCSDAAIAAAAARKGPHGGEEELNAPSCPVASQVGTSLAGAGVGSVLVYVPGKVYLAGPYHGAPISIVAITAAKAGPFDLGTVVVREALKVNPETAEVFVDATGSDPIPHIIQGIPVHLRDIRVNVDRPEFVLNPTNCTPTSTASTVLGSGLDFVSELDDNPITVTSRFQAADCAHLKFKPKLSLSLKGGTKRGASPALKAVLKARKGDANIGEAQVTLPHSEFLEQGHIGTVCTRVQFKEGGGNGEKCPAASIYGYVKATTPLLDEPLAGPVFLRSSNHPLPDVVAALNSGKIDIALDGRIDSVKGQIRSTFEAIPDAPVTRFTLRMKGGKKSLFVNSTSLCRKSHRAISHLVGQNGKVYDTHPIVKASCAKKSKKHHAKKLHR